MSLLTQITSVLRDFNVAGLPASGAHEPVKADVRALLAEIVATIANGGETLSSELAEDIAAIAADLENIDAIVAAAISAALVDAVADATAAADASAITAAAAAATAPMVYTTTAAGLAAVSEGGTFWVSGSSGLGLYRDVSGVATLIDSLPLSSTVRESLSFGNTATQAIDTNLSGSPIGADIGQIFIGNTVSSADAITIDSGPNFPPGAAFRKYRGTPGSPTVVVAGDQTGYIDFRGYSGTEMWNHASIDAVVDGLSPFTDGELPPAKLRFATAIDDGGAIIRMEIRANGRVEIGAIDGEDYYGPVSGFDPILYVNSLANDWAFISYAQPASGAGYACRFHTLGETVNDYLIGGSSGAGTGSFKFSVRGNGDVLLTGVLKVDDVQVLGPQGAAVADATDAASAITQLNALLARCRAHGLIAT